MYRLTEEGKEYIENGLPEKQLIRFLENEKPMEEVIKFPKSQIAIGWARKNGWIIIENNIVKVTEAGKKSLKEKTEIEKELENVDKFFTVSDKVRTTLSNRNLIIEVKEKIEERHSFWKRMFSGKKETKPSESVRGDEIAQLTPEIIKSGEWKNKTFRKYDVHAPAPKMYAGKKQPYVQIIEAVREKLIGLGFQEMRGPLIELAFWNFDSLFVPQDHPARGLHDAFFLKRPNKGELPDENLISKVKATHEGGWVTESTGWGGLWKKEEAEKLVMRSHGTAVSARTLFENKDKPQKYFMIDRNFRVDVTDAKHLMEFDHCEGIVVGENLTLRHLLGFLKEIAEFFGAQRVKFKPSFFPYTEPSVELYVDHPKFGWVEGGGAGMMRPEVLRPLGLEKSQVLAWGLGIGRLSMLTLGIDDIRTLYSDNLEWLRNKEIVIL